MKRREAYIRVWPKNAPARACVPTDGAQILPPVRNKKRKPGNKKALTI